MAPLSINETTIMIPERKFMKAKEKVSAMDAQETRWLINPAGSEVIYESMKFSQAVQVGNIVWISGQVGMDENFKIGVGVEAQARRAFLNLKHVLQTAGGSLSDIVELITYHTSMQDMQAFGKVKGEFIPENFPAWTAVGVTALVLPELLLEIRATAFIDRVDK